MSTSGPFRPTAVAEDMSSGSSSTASLANIIDTNPATETGAIGTNGFNSYYVVCTGYGFSIPAGATINGITLVFHARRTGPAGFFPSIYLVKGGTVQTGGTNKTILNATLTTTLADYTLGGPADLWGVTLTDTDVNASNFGFAFQGFQLAMGRSAAGDALMTVDYTTAAGVAGSSTMQLMGV